MKELIETEEEFGKDLQLVVERYLKPLDNPDVPRTVRDNKEIIFTNLKQIADFHNTYVFTAPYIHSGIKKVHYDIIRRAFMDTFHSTESNTVHIFLLSIFLSYFNNNYY